MKTNQVNCLRIEFVRRFEWFDSRCGCCRVSAFGLIAFLYILLLQLIIDLPRGVGHFQFVSLLDIGPNRLIANAYDDYDDYCV